MNKRHGFFWCGCLVAVLFMLCQSTVGAAPQAARIVSLGPYLTEALFSLGAEEYLVGVTTYCEHPEAARRLAKVGGVVDINPERIVVLRPDAVLATPLTQAKVRQRLRHLGIRVIDFEQPRNFGDICAQLRRLARLVDRVAEGEFLIGAAEERLAEVRGRVQRQPAVSVFLQVGSRPLFTMPGGNFVDHMIEQAGGRNIAADAPSGLYAREMVLSQDPEVLIIATMGIVSEDERRRWEQYSGLRAVRSGRIHTLDQYLVGSPTPLNFVRAVEMIAAYLHPLPGAIDE